MHIEITRYHIILLVVISIHLDVLQSYVNVLSIFHRRIQRCVTNVTGIGNVYHSKKSGTVHVDLAILPYNIGEMHLIPPLPKITTS